MGIIVNVILLYLIAEIFFFLNKVVLEIRATNENVNRPTLSKLSQHKLFLPLIRIYLNVLFIYFSWYPSQTHSHDNIEF